MFLWTRANSAMPWLSLRVTWNGGVTSLAQDRFSKPGGSSSAITLAGLLHELLNGVYDCLCICRGHLLQVFDSLLGARHY